MSGYASARVHAGAARRCALLALRGAGLMLALSVMSCGGGGDSLTGGSSSASSSSTGTVTGPTVSGSNVVAVTVSSGPNGNALNTLYTTVTVCVPGTSTCQTIDNIEVDTMSYGFRLLAPALTLSLPVATTNGSSLLECTTFVDGYSWGPVALVDLKVGGEKAASIPVQLIGDSRFPTVPGDCASSGPSAEDTVAEFGANGLLGIGPFAQDCGTSCADQPEPAAYYACSSASSCEATAVPVADQVQNPVPFFTTDNNGSLIELPGIPSAGAASVSGSLIFGIDTESNNQLGGLTILALGPSTSTGQNEPMPGDFYTVFQGQTYTQGFIDSGSNGLYFDDSSITQCAGNDLGGFYCPSSTLDLTASLQGAGGNSVDVSFVLANTETLLEAESTYAAFSNIGGTLSLSGGFDWGLPFFYGRTVAYAIEGQKNSAGTAPFVAF